LKKGINYLKYSLFVIFTEGNQLLFFERRVKPNLK